MIDEVFDEGGGLLFRKREKEQRVASQDITNIKSNNVKVIIKVSNQVELEKKLTFNLLPRLFYFSKDPYYLDLTDRVYNASNT